eukprot:NODE_97_length_20652_cov_0.832093.p1 type:complete len:757 gc:universal NODE_97_length_20652_cov_0.832093:6572-8842(+)
MKNKGPSWLSSWIPPCPPFISKAYRSLPTINKSIFTKSILILVILNILITKAGFLIKHHIHQKFHYTYHLFFTMDLVYLILFALFAPLNSIFQFIYFQLIININAVSWLYCFETGEEMSWSLMRSAFANIDSIMRIGGDQSRFLWIFFLSYNVGLFLVYIILLKISNRYHQYTPLLNNPSPIDYKISNKILMLCFIIFVFPLLLIPNNQYLYLYRNEIFESHFYLVVTISHLFRLLTNPIRPTVIPNYSVKLPQDRLFKNLVVILLETSRSSMIPSQINGTNNKWYETHGIQPELVPTITPFLNSLNMVNIPLQSTSGYTIKSTVSTLCGIYPLPVDYTVEHAYTPYTHCLPKLMDNNQFNTHFIQTADGTFDHQQDTFKTMGFQNIIGKLEMKSYFKEHHEDEPELVNYFGYLDHANLPFIDRAWNSKPNDKCDKNEHPNEHHREHHKNRHTRHPGDHHQYPNAPVFISHITNTMHHPYHFPKSHPVTKYVNYNEDLNNYLNTIQYTDGYLKDLFQLLNGTANSNPDAPPHPVNNLENTLVVMIGDHGLMTGEHGQFGTSEIKYEDAFEIPCFIYSEHPQFKKIQSKLESSIKNSEYITSLDVLPTIIDLMMLTENDLKLKNATALEMPVVSHVQEMSHTMEGHSLLNPVHNEFRLSFSNPGFSWTVVRYGKYKLLVSRTDVVYFVDLLVDPTESNLMVYDDLEPSAEEIKDCTWQSTEIKCRKKNYYEISREMRAYQTKMIVDIMGKWGYEKYD